MRKNQQKQILDLLDTIEEALAEMKRLSSKNNTPGIMQLLADCQEGVFQAGTYIENLEGKGTQTVTLLETIYESLYQAAVEISSTAENGGNGIKADNNFIKQLKKLLFKVKNSVNTELKPNKLEIVFFPYKASMWDAFESVWLAAKDDPQCDVYVVPIPYYDRLPNGDLGQMHYEGDQYPGYVPVVDYRSYDVKSRRPDVIFVHNPYDGGNYVTSVHPDFYSEHLKDYTDLLVYIPYFVSTGNVGEHFCVCPGTLYADKVFLQSESIRDTYYRVFKQFEKANRCVGRFGDSRTKFVASGSPKFDRVIHSKPEDFTLPDAWRRLIEGPDGTTKKIVLYNTSVGSILEGNAQYIKKLRHVLDTFRSRDDVVLWWRPHPLSATTYEAMRPELLQEYKEIISEYIREGYGIYDDSADMNRAIAMSSCYFGDRSSLVSLYQCTGKPILLQMPHFIFPSDEHVLFPDGIFEHENTFLVSSLTYNALFQVDMKSLQTSFIGHFPSERLDECNLYHSAVRHGDSIYFAPLAAKEMAVFNPADNTFSKIEIPMPGIAANYKKGSYKFNSIHSFEGFIYLVGYCYPAILQYDPVVGRFRQFNDWLPDIERLRPNGKENDTTYFYGSIAQGEEILAASTVANAVLVFNMRTCTSKVFQVGSEGRTFSGICFDGENYWLSPRGDGIVVRWNRATGACKEFDTEIGGEGSAFAGTVFAGGYVWMFPYAAKHVLRIDPKTEGIEVIDAFNEFCDEQSGSYRNRAFSVIKEYDGKILSFADRPADFIEYDPDTTELKRHHLTLNRLPDIHFAARYGDFQENGMYTLHAYLDDITSLNEGDEILLQRAQVRRQTIANGDGTAGEKIYALVKQQVLGV